MTKHVTFRLLATALAAAMPAAVSAQAMVQALPGTTDADALAAAMRRVAANPVDLSALLDAGDLSLRVDDISAAASFFARADKVDPRNGRVKAGMGSILVRAERPGEALRYFQEAAQLGLAPVSFAADQGYAYDLTGDQPRAQRDYRTVLAARPDDAEVIRRYALSLGIAGRKDEALAAIEPLTRKQDRGAWRARAFILAMNGDVAQANHIAQTMMPGGTAQGLAPFFARLPTLGPVDRAFAVHFGEVRPTPERLADARLAPSLPPLPPEARPVQLAAATPDDRRNRRRDRDRRVAPPVQVAQQTPATATPVVQSVRPSSTGAIAVPPRTVAAASPLPSAPTVVMPPRSAAVPLTAAGEGSYRMPTSVPTPAVSVPPPQLAAAAPPQGSLPSATAVRPPQVALVTPPQRSVPAVSVPATPAPPAQGATVAPREGSVPAALTTTSGVTAPVSPAAPVASGSTALARPFPAEAAAVVPPPTPRAHDDAALARIIAGLSIPASELGTAPLPHRQVAAVLPDATVDAARDRATRDAAEKQAALDKIAAAKAAADKKAADRKAARALADRKAAAATKAEEAREAAEERKAERANPERIWVQVAGGAYEGDLGKAWAATKARAPDLFAGHSGYTTPLRATNRVVTGPFKTQADARAFVNQLAKKGVSAFPFTSDAGQKIAKLPAK